MVWIHGGSNVSGAASEPIYDGARFARSGVICVTLDYRMGVLGFLELGDQLGSRYAGSGNNAIRDQILALRWIRRNIAAFGGDPGRVTLAGESAGAKDVAALVAAPAARGLFSRVILESGGGRTVLSMTAAREITLEYLRLLSLPPLKTAALLHLDLDRLIEAQHELMLDPPHNFPLRPIVDGVLLPAMPEDAIRDGCMKSWPLLLGTNRDESRLFLGPGAATQPLQARNLGNLQPDSFERILQHYDASITVPDPAELRWRALTAEEYWIPSVRVAEAQCHAGARSGCIASTCRAGRRVRRSRSACQRTGLCLGQPGGHQSRAAGCGFRCGAGGEDACGPGWRSSPAARRRLRTAGVATLRGPAAGNDDPGCRQQGAGRSECAGAPAMAGVLGAT